MKKFLSLTSLTLALVACSHIDVPVQSSIKVPEKFEKSPPIHSSASSITPSETNDLRQWWTLWQDTQLTHLIETALHNNADIALAKARFDEAQAISGLAQADKGPTVGASARASRADTRLEDIPFVDHIDNRIQGGALNLMASWEVDFFGKKSSDAQAALYAALSKEQQLHATQLAIVSGIAQAYLQWNGTQQQYNLLTQNIHVLQQLHRYLQGRFQAGHVTRYDVDEVYSKLLSLQSNLATLQAKADVIQRQIAVLVGIPPQSFTLEKNISVLSQKPPIPTGQLPGTVLKRRPDMQAYELAVKARTAQLASAKADLYPRFDIQFLGHGGRISLSDDLSSFSEFASIVSVGIQLPLFTNGRIQANIDAADARLKASLIDYDKALLKALAEVDNYYQLTDAFTQKVSVQTQHVNQQRHQASQAYLLFKHGNKTLDNALTAQLDTLSAQQELLQAQLQQHENTILLYKALGGGW